MASASVRRLVVMPGVIDHAHERPSTAVEAVQGLLAGHASAAHLLSEARHRAIVARESAAEAVRAARAGRDAELAHELAVRDSDRRRRWRLHFGPAAVAVGALLVLCLAAAFALTRSLPMARPGDHPAAPPGSALSWRGGQWRNRERRWAHHLVVLVAAAVAAALVALCVLSTAGGLTLRIVVSVVLGLILVAMLHCGRLGGGSCRELALRQAAPGERPRGPVPPGRDGRCRP